jgi:hypothetical protein
MCLRLQVKLPDRSSTVTRVRFQFRAVKSCQAARSFDPDVPFRVSTDRVDEPTRQAVALAVCGENPVIQPGKTGCFPR